jgi:hypothetical protein
MKFVSDQILTLRNKLDKIEDKLEFCQIKRQEFNMRFMLLFETRENLNKEISQLKIQLESISQSL